MATAARSVRCQLIKSRNSAVRPEPVAPVQVPIPKSAKIVLQPRLCTLRSYGPDQSGAVMMKTKPTTKNHETSPFFAALSEYIESSRKSHDFEVLCGRLAMVVFAATVATEVATGNSLFGKVEVEGIAEGAGVCLAAVACAAVAAWMASARTRVGRILGLGCNAFIDGLIDQIVDGLFSGSDLSDWSDDT